MANAVNWFEIAGEPGLLDFYRDLLGWRPAEPVPGYHVVDAEQQAGANGAGTGGAIATREAPGAPYAIFFVEVDDVDRAVRRVAELGGSVALAPTDSGPVRLAHVTDPAGNRVGLYHPKG